MSVLIDPRAVVSPGAHLDSTVTVGPFAIIEAGAVIGAGSSIGPSSFIGSGARIGKDCRIHHCATVGHAPQDLKYANEPTTCEVGDRTVVREYTALHRGTAEGGGRTIIGEDNFLMAYVHVAHDCHLGKNVIMAGAAMMAGHVLLEDFVIIGGMTPIHQFVRVGRHAMVGGGLRVPKDVPPYSMAGHEPLVFEGLNSVGLRRRGFKPEIIKAIDDAYTLIYRSKLNVSQGLARIRETPSLMAVEEVRNIVEFVAASKRGIIGMPRSSH